MNKKLTKPYAKNVRLDRPCGLIGVPPDMPPAAFTVPNDKVIMIVDKPTALRVLNDIRMSDTLPS